ncbi:PepSY domain-containing protein [Mucilaginibacter sp. 21P]|uniref:PepSY-associated TM helix domain-containing protein n=1 Tax=Mucilaginibacter sp. 21P TaxID=2778902 RepID=UPI001C59A686|nr:PepSY-associated TM helix domain-containing protein [Mucilaginibacter sp. 21P]QXV63950.1 PepSY domain-containing protein [Mucilaginibacter sp. 21P]
MKKKGSAWQWAKHQKRWFGKWHTYLGVIAGAIVALIGVTGSILVFQDEIDRALNPELFRVAARSHRLNFAEVAEIMKVRYPEYQVTAIGNSDVTNLNLPYRISVRQNKNADGVTELYLNPFNGELTGKRNFQSSLMQVVMRLHMSLLLDLPGRLLAGVSTLVLLIITISGLRLWIPAKWKQFRSVLTVKFDASFKRQNYDWHNVIGFYTAPFVIMLCLTGFSLNIGIIAAPALIMTGGERIGVLGKLINAKSTVKAGATPLSLDQLLRIAGSVMPNGQIKDISFPAKRVGTYTLEVVNPGKIYPVKTDILMIDQYSGQVVFNSTRDFQPIGKAYINWLKPVHYGSFGGLPTKILALLAGLSPLVLFITGVIIWWPRYRKQSADKLRPLKLKKDYQTSAMIEPPSLKTVFTRSFRSGTRYALWTALMSFLSGAFYGLLSGVVIEPAALAVYMTFGIVIMNFVFALIAFIASWVFKTMVLFKRKVSIRGTIRYFGLSLSFLLVFLVLFLIVSRSGLVNY